MKDQSIFIFVSQSLFLGMKDLNIEYFGGDGITKYQCSVCINLGWQTLVLHQAVNWCIRETLVSVSCTRERKSGRKLITAMNLCVQCAPYKCYLGDFKRIYHSNDTVPILPDKCICKTVMDACVCLQNGHKLCACVLGD